MSYQPGAYQQNPYQAGQYQQPGYPAARRAGGVLLAVGVILVLLGIIVGGAIYVSGKNSYSTKAKNLGAKSGALSGCVTDLTFDKPGVYTLYYVSKGTVRINGANDGCSTSDVVPVAADPIAPKIGLRLTNSEGKSLKLGAPTASGIVRVGGVVAEPYRQVTIGTVGDYRLEVASPDTGLPFAIGVGQEISKQSSLLALVVGLVGVVFGVGAVLFGLAQGGAASTSGVYGAGGYGQGYPGYAQQPPVAPYPAQQAPYPPQGQRPAAAPPVARPPQSGGARSGQPGMRPAQPGQPGPRPSPQTQGRPPQVPPPTVRQPQQAPPPVARPAQQSPAQQRPAQQGSGQQGSGQQGSGLPPIVSSEDESGSISSPAPTQRMPSTGWERQASPPPTRPLTSQRAVPPPDSEEEYD
jgi:hypothetical protein